MFRLQALHGAAFRTHRQIGQTAMSLERSVSSSAARSATRISISCGPGWRLGVCWLRRSCSLLRAWTSCWPSCSASACSPASLRSARTPRPSCSCIASSDIRDRPPGNVIERALSSSGIVLSLDLSIELRASEGRSLIRSGSGGLVVDRPTLAEQDQRFISLILQQQGGNKKRAAEVLRIDRRTLYRSLERSRTEREVSEDNDS